MTYQMTVTPMEAYLHVRVTGKNTPENVRDYLAKARAACIEHRRPKLLIEEDLEKARLWLMTGGR